MDPTPLRARYRAALFPIALRAVERGDTFLETAPLLKLVNEHSALDRWLNLPGAELCPDFAKKRARIGEVWAAIARRFPAYIARHERLAAERAEHEARVRRLA